MESYDAAKLLRSFRNLHIEPVSFHCFLAHVELEKELFAAWNQVPWPYKGLLSLLRSKRQPATFSHS